jgi:hypothetical protein
MAEDQQFYRQFWQSTTPDGGSTVREVVSPTLLDHDAAAAAEQSAGRTFTGFVTPDKMSGARAPATPPAAPAAAPAPLPSATIPTAGAVPTGTNLAQPGGSPWLSAIPPALATVGPLALAIAQPELGVPLWAASAGLAALGGGAGEGIRQHLAGEELSPAKMAEQGAVSGATDALMGQVVLPLATPVVKAVGGRIFPTLGAVEELGPVLAAREAATTAAPTIQGAANTAATTVRSASEPAFDAARAAGRGLPVHTAGLDPHVTAATNAVTAAGATPAQVAEFGTVVRPMSGGAPADYGQLIGRERQLENWVSGMRAQGAEPAEVAAVERLHGAVGAQLDAAAAGTPAAPMRAQYVAVQSEALPTRYALSSVEGGAADLAAQSPGTIQAIAQHTAAADRPALAAAWVDGARRTAGQSANPVLTMRALYDGLGADTQAALFGAQRGAFERVLGTATGGIGELKSLAVPAALGGGAIWRGLPGAGALTSARVAGDLAAPVAATGALMSPRIAAFGGGLSRATGIAAPTASRFVAQTAAERAQQAGLPF